MNIYRLLGDFSHLFSLILLIYKICKYKSCAGISGKSQILQALVFTSRYLDIYTRFLSYYNFTFKVVFIALSYVSVFLTLFLFRKTYERKIDTFCFEILIVVAFVLSVFVNFDLTVIEVLWAFSIYLEALVMWPQFYMIAKTKQVTKLVFYYLFGLGFYRTMYVFNWVYRYIAQNHYDPISTYSGIVQIVPFYIFFLFCITKRVTIKQENIISSYYDKNIVENNVFTIKLAEEFPKPTSDIPHLQETTKKKLELVTNT